MTKTRVERPASALLSPLAHRGVVVVVVQVDGALRVAVGVANEFGAPLEAVFVVQVGDDFDGRRDYEALAQLVAGGLALCNFYVSPIVPMGLRAARAAPSRAGACGCGGCLARGGVCQRRGRGRGLRAGRRRAGRVTALSALKIFGGWARARVRGGGRACALALGFGSACAGHAALRTEAEAG